MSSPRLDAIRTQLRQAIARNDVQAVKDVIRTSPKVKMTEVLRENRLYGEPFWVNKGNGNPEIGEVIWGALPRGLRVWVEKGMVTGEKLSYPSSMHQEDMSVLTHVALESLRGLLAWGLTEKAVHALPHFMKLFTPRALKPNPLYTKWGRDALLLFLRSPFPDALLPHYADIFVPPNVKKHAPPDFASPKESPVHENVYEQCCHMDKTLRTHAVAWFSAPPTVWEKSRDLVDLTCPSLFLLTAAAYASQESERLQNKVTRAMIWQRLHQQAPHAVDAWMHQVHQLWTHQGEIQRGRPLWKEQDSTILCALPMPLLKQSAQKQGKSGIHTLLILAALYRPLHEAPAWLRWAWRHGGEEVCVPRTSLCETAQPLSLPNVFEALLARHAHQKLSEIRCDELFLEEAVLEKGIRSSSSCPFQRLAAWWKASRQILPEQHHAVLLNSASQHCDALLALNTDPLKNIENNSPLWYARLQQNIVTVGATLSETYWFTPATLSVEDIVHVTTWWSEKTPPTSYTTRMNSVRSITLPDHAHTRGASWEKQFPALRPLIEKDLLTALLKEAPPLTDSDPSARPAPPCVRRLRL